VTATLAYGYNLGVLDDFKAVERDEYGGPAPAWYDDEGPEFAAQFYDALYAASGLPAEPSADKRGSAAGRHFGVEVAFCGTDQYQGWLLIATGSEQQVCNADVLVLDLRDLEHPPNEWFERLTAAVETVGITPTQDWPRWLVFPSLG
jgi:hypothetical protein